MTETAKPAKKSLLESLEQFFNERAVELIVSLFALASLSDTIAKKLGKKTGNWSAGEAAQQE